MLIIVNIIVLVIDAEAANPLPLNKTNHVERCQSSGETNLA